MAMFPGDMNIGWGFGIEPPSEEQQPVWVQAINRLSQRMENLESRFTDAVVSHVPFDESQLTDPMLAVSKLEQRIEQLEGMLKTYFDEAPTKRIFTLEQRITDLEERLGNLCIVVNVLIEQVHRVVHDEGRIDGHRAILTSLVGKVATLENHVEFLRTGIEKE